MKIVQLLFASAPHFERKLRAIDARELKLFAEIEMIEESSAQALDALRTANLIHVYAGDGFPPRLLASSGTPFVSTAMPREKRWPWAKQLSPARLLEIGGRSAVPEAVDDSFFKTRKRQASPPFRIGVFVGPRDVRAVVNGTGERLARVRDDIEWLLFDEPPSPADLALVDIWLDPSTSENDRDGFAAEAIASGLVTIATRTATNRWRLDEGRAGILVPPHPNEIAHALLEALFKPETVAERIAQMPAAAERFRAVNRATALMRVYREVGR